MKNGEENLIHCEDASIFVSLQLLRGLENTQMLTIVKFEDFEEMKFVIAEKSFAIFTAVMNDKKIIIKMRHNISDINVHTTNLEEELLVKARHPNIIRAHAAGFRPKRFLVVDDYLIGGTLDSIIRQHSRGLPMKMALSIAMELALALKYLHQDMHPNAMVILRGKFYLFIYYVRLILELSILYNIKISAPP